MKGNLELSTGDINIEVYSLENILNDNNIVNEFKKNHIDVVTFLELFRFALINESIESLVQLGIDNYDESIHEESLGGYTLISELLKKININISPIQLKNEAHKRKCQNNIEKVREDMEKVLNKKR